MLKKLVIAAVATVLIFLAMRWQGQPLITDQSPAGIVSFELAKTLEQATTIIAAAGKTNLQINIIIDFLFILAYTSFFVFCCRALIDSYRLPDLKNMSAVFLRLSIVAGFLDFIENVAMLVTLGGYGSDTSVLVTSWAAIIKFALAALIIVYILIAAFVVLTTSKKSYK